MSTKYRTLAVHKDGDIVFAQLHRPEARNAINMQMVLDLHSLADEIADASDVATLVLQGGKDVFCSGIDMADFSSERAPDIHGFNKWEQACRKIESLDNRTIAAVQGDCVGGGVHLVLVCDIRIAENRAIFQLDEVRRGFLPGLATFRLAKYSGLGRAKDLILNGRPVEAKEAAEIGLIDRVCEASAFSTEVRAAAEATTDFHTIAHQMARRLLNESFSENFEDFVGAFLAAQDRCINSESFRRLIVETLTEKKFDAEVG